MDQSLRDAAEQESIDALYELIGRDAKVLDTFDEIPFVDTPLHVAASTGNILFAKEIMRLNPSFAKKLNQDGFTPMHLALQNNQTQLMHRLLDVDKDLVRVQGREGVTPLHYAAQTGKLKFLALCFEVCPDSIEDVTIRGENVLHIALKYDKVETFLLAINWIRRTWLIKDAFSLEKKLLFCKDEEGNTLFHVAVSKVSRDLLKVVLPLLDTGLVDLNAKNLNDQTVFDILEDQTKKDKKYDPFGKLRNIKNKLQPRPLRRLTFLLSPFQFLKGQYVTMRRAHTLIADERLNALLVVGTLLITVTFQAALTPPKSRQNLFLLFNALTYCLTTITLFVLIPPGLIGFVLHKLLLLLLACFCVSTLVITTHNKIFIVLSVLFGYTFYTLFVYLVNSSYQSKYFKRFMTK